MYSEMGDEPSTRAGWRNATSWRGGLLAAMLVAVATMVTACGSSSESAGSSEQGEQQGGSSEETTASPVEAVQVAYKTTTEAKTAKVGMDIAISGLPASTTSIRTTGQGVIGFENKTADLTTQTPMGELEARQIGTTIYEKLPDRLASQTAAQKPWIKMDLDAMTRQQFGASFSELQGSAPSDPTEQLGYLQGTSDSVEEVGTEEVRGTPATHYRATVDLEKAAEEQGAQQNAQLRQAYDKIEQQLGTSTLPMDVWLDEQGRVVRLEMNMPVPVPAGPSSRYANQQGGSSQGQIDITEEFYDFGTPVSVEAPPEEQTADVADLLSAQQAPKPR